MKYAIAAAAFALITLPAVAEDFNKLKDGAGKDVVEQNCSVCHSLEYIPMNSPFLDRAKWDATIKKMQGPLGAPISPQDAAVILDYLTKNYGG